MVTQQKVSILTKDRVTYRFVEVEVDGEKKVSVRREAGNHADNYTMPRGEAEALWRRLRGQGWEKF